MKLEQFESKLSGLQKQQKSIRPLLKWIAMGLNPIKKEQPVSGLLEILAVTEKLEIYLAEYEARILEQGGMLKLKPDSALAIKHDVATKLCQFLQPVLAGKESDIDGVLTKVRAYYVDLFIFEKKYQVVIEGQHSKMKSLFDSHQFIFQIHGEQQGLASKKKNNINACFGFDDGTEYQKIFSDIAKNHAELLEYALLEQEGKNIRVLETACQADQSLIARVMPVIERIRLPLIQKWLMQAIRENLSIVGPLLHAKLNAISRLPKKLRTPYDLQEACQASLDDSLNKSEETIFGVLDVIHSFQSTFRKQLLLDEKGDLRYPTSRSSGLYKHLKTNVFLKLDALLRSPIAIRLYEELKFSPAEIRKNSAIRFYDTLLSSYLRLTSMSLNARESAIALGVRSLISGLVKVFLTGESRQEFDRLCLELKNYVNKHAASSCSSDLLDVLQSLADLWPSVRSVEAEDTLLTEGGAAAVGEDSPKISGRADAEEESGYVSEAEGKSVVLRKVEARDFSDYQRFKRFMQMDFLEMPVAEQVEFLANSKFNEEPVFISGTIRVENPLDIVYQKTSAPLKESKPVEYLRKSALYYLDKKSLYKMVVFLGMNKYSINENKLYRAIGAELKNRGVDPVCFEKILKLIEVTSQFKPNYQNLDAAPEADQGDKSKRQFRSEYHALMKGLNSYFYAFLQEVILENVGQSASIFSGIPVKYLAFVMKSGFLSAGEKINLDGFTDVQPVDEKLHIESRQQVLPVLSWMLRHFYAEKDKAHFQGLLRWIDAQSGLNKRSISYLRRFANLLSLNEKIIALSEKYAGIAEDDRSPWKVAVVNSIKKLIQSVINYPEDDADSMADIDSMWERKLKTMLAVFQPGSRIRKKANHMYFRSDLKNILASLEKCVTESQFQVSREELKAEIRSANPDTGLYNAYLFHYVFHYQRSLLASDALLGDFGKSVLRAAAKYDEKIVAEFFQAISDLDRVDDLIPEIAAALDLTTSKMDFVFDLIDHFSQETRINILLHKDPDTDVFFIHENPVYRHIEFEDYVACLQRIVSSDNLDKSMIAAIKDAWDSKYRYQLDLHDDNERTGMAPIAAPTQTLDYAAKAADLFLGLPDGDVVRFLKNTAKSVLDNSANSQGVPVSDLITLAKELSLAISRGAIDLTVGGKLEDIFSLSALLNNDFFIRRLYVDVKTIPLADFWTLQRHFVFSGNHKSPSSVDEPYQNRKLCDELFVATGRRDDQSAEASTYRQLMKCIAIYKQLLVSEAAYNDKIRVVSENQKEMMSHKKTVCIDLIAELEVMGTDPNYSDLTTAGASLGNLLLTIKSYLDNPANEEQLKGAEKGWPSELKKILVKLSDLCGANCNYRHSRNGVAPGSPLARGSQGGNGGGPPASPPKKGSR